MNQIQELWPGWEIVRVLGQGSFGAVYEIQRNLYGRVESAALKVISVPQSLQEITELRNEGYDDGSITAHYQNYLQEIIREYTVMLDLKGHTNVVYCDDIRYMPREGGIGWDVFIKMELLTPLTGYLSSNYDEQQVIRMGIDLCNALVLCKNENILHRDIKPQNIFVSRTGDYKLGDFGVAKIAEKTVSGTKIGTYKYMAPEVYLNQPYGFSSDLYAVGLVLYWAMNERRTPFLPLPPAIPKPSEEEEARQRRFNGESIPVPSHGSKALRDIVLKACAYNPRDRFPDPAQMRDALMRLNTAAPAEDERTVGVFSDRPVAVPMEPQEEATVGVFSTPKQPPEPVKEPEPPVAQVPPAAPQQPEKKLDMNSPEFQELFEQFFGKPTQPPKTLEQLNKPEQSKKSEQPPVKKSKKFPVALVCILGVLVILAVVLAIGMGSGSRQPEPIQTEPASQITGNAWAENVMDNFTTGIASVSAESPAFGNNSIPRGQVIAVNFMDSLAGFDVMEQDGLKMDQIWDVTPNKSGKVMAGAVREGSDRYQIWIAADGGINGFVATIGMFQGFTSLEAISFEDAFHTEYAVDMSNMFAGCSSLFLMDCENLDTSMVTSVAHMFSGCTSLDKSVIDLALANWDLGYVTEYEGFSDHSQHMEFFN